MGLINGYFGNICNNTINIKCYHIWGGIRICYPLLNLNGGWFINASLTKNPLYGFRSSIPFIYRLTGKKIRATGGSRTLDLLLTKESLYL